MKILELSRGRIFAGILLFGLLGMTARPATDPDLWWHLRTGQWIVETGHVPHSDSFSFTRAGHAWVSHEWLSEVVFYELWKHGGAAALIVFSAIITTAGFLLLYLRCLLYGVQKHWAAAATAFGALASAPSWGVRPQMFTFTLASLLLWLLESANRNKEDRPKFLLWIPPLFLLWLNLHAGFALGLALLFAYGLGLIMETAAGNTPWQEVRPIVLRVMLLLLACLALVPLNPSGAQLYHYPFDTLRSPGMRSFIVEWFSPDFHDWLYRPFLLLWPLLMTALASSRSRPKGRVIVPLLLTSFAALDAVRHIPIFVLVAIPVIAAALPVARASPEASQRHPDFSRFRPLFNTAVVILIAVFALVKWVSLARSQDTREAEQYPQERSRSCRPAPKPRDSSSTMTGEAIQSGNSIPNIAYLWTAARTSMATSSCASLRPSCSSGPAGATSLTAGRLRRCLCLLPARWLKPSFSTPIGMLRSPIRRRSSCSTRTPRQWSDGRPRPSPRGYHQFMEGVLCVSQWPLCSLW